MEKTELLKTEFSTADAENARFHYKSGDFVFEYQDWQEKPVKIVFRDVLGVRWQEAEPASDQFRNDSTYPIEDSSWLHEHVEQKMTDQGVDYKHLKLCFNALGVLDVLCGKFEVET